MVDDPEYTPRSETDVLRAAIGALAERLPEGWRIEDVGSTTGMPRAPERLLRATAPDDTFVTLALHAKLILTGRDVAHAASRLAPIVERQPESVRVVAARYLSPPTRRLLTEAGLSYVDATGNIRLNAARPAMFISDRGADRDPWRRPGRPRGTLKGAPAAKIVRALADFDHRWNVRSLIQVADVSTGSAYRVIEFLTAENLIDREKSGTISVPDWSALLRRWSEDYGFVRNSRISRWIAPRGLESLLKRAARAELEEYAVTGTFAAEEWAAYAPARAAMIYTPDAEKAAAAWGLRAADTGANVILAEPDIDIAFTRTLVSDRRKVMVAAPTQVAVDLMTGPGRGPAEADALLNWMKQRESSWRR